MPKQNQIILKCFIVLGCGKKTTETMWQTSPPVFAYENNKTILDAYAMQIDQNYKTGLKMFEHYKNNDIVDRNKG